MIPMYVPTIDLNKFAESIVDNLYRNSNKANKAIEFAFRIEIDHYNGKEDNPGMGFYFTVIYYAPSNYVKVFYRRNSNPFASPEDTKQQGYFTCIADHDSCWRDCWSDICKEYNESIDKFIINNKLTKEDVQKLSYYSNMEHVRELTINESHRENCKEGYPRTVEFRYIENSDHNYDLYYFDDVKSAMKHKEK